MEKNTKILIGVGIAAVAAYFVYRSKSKAKTQTGAVKDKCPEGFVYAPINCFKAPCPEGECIPMDMLPPKLEQKPLPPIFQPKPKPLPVSSKCPAGSKEQIVMCIKAPCPSICIDKTGDMVRPINDDIMQNDSEYRSEPVDFPNRKYKFDPTKFGYGSIDVFADDLMKPMPINYKAELQQV